MQPDKLVTNNRFRLEPSCFWPSTGEPVKRGGWRKEEGGGVAGVCQQYSCSYRDERRLCAAIVVVSRRLRAKKKRGSHVNYAEREYPGHANRATEVRVSRVPCVQSVVRMTSKDGTALRIVHSRNNVINLWLIIGFVGIFCNLWKLIIKFLMNLKSFKWIYLIDISKFSYDYSFTEHFLRV